MSVQMHPKAFRRAWQDQTGEINRRRFRKVLDRLNKREKSEDNAVIWTDTDWHYAGRRGLIHKGRKPRG